MAVKSVQMEAKARSEKGSRANKRLRDAGFVPGVIYGHKQAVISVTLPGRDVKHHLAHGAHLFSLNLDGNTETVLVKDVQYDHLGSDVLHIDFSRVNLNERVKVTVPLELKGTPKGEADGGVLTQVIAELEVECLVTEIPELIRHNVAEMALNDVLHIKDIKAPEGVRILQDPELIAATVKEVLEVVAAAPAAEGGAAAAEPEIIGRKAAEEGEAEAAPAGEGKEKEKK
ncbi:MAG TPA: 50S ribosomal protein L25 [Tepidisphaeraceae bacterium]|nr:50S ribosomal protein L25 [Tepidisphaeraceae bacterium]